MITPLGPNLSAILSQVNSAQPTNSPASVTDTPTGGFADVFKAAVHQVDTLQSSADQQVSSVLQGQGNTDVGNVMASVEKADIAFQLMMQVRNKIVSAYQDIEKMQF